MLIFKANKLFIVERLAQHDYSFGFVTDSAKLDKNL